MAVSPGGRYVVTVNAGYGTFESQYEQSLAVLDTQTGALEDFPDDRTLAQAAKQTLYSGLAFSRDGSRVYASMGSTSDPLGDGKDKTGNGVVVYSFTAGKIAPERLIHLPLQQLAPGRKTKLIGEAEGDKGVPFPAAIAVVGPAGAEKLLVADNLSDDVLLLDAASGKIEKRFDLLRKRCRARDLSHCPGGLKGRRRGPLWLCGTLRRSWNSIWPRGRWGASWLCSSRPARWLRGRTHARWRFSPDGETLYVALANRDAVAAVNVGAGQFSVKGYFDTRLPGQSYFGAEPEALALNADGSRLYVANTASDAVAVIDTRQADREGCRTQGHGGADRLRAHGVDAHVHGVCSLSIRRKALCCHRQRAREPGPTTFPNAQTEEPK